MNIGLTAGSRLFSDSTSVVDLLGPLKRTGASAQNIERADLLMPNPAGTGNHVKLGDSDTYRAHGMIADVVSHDR